MVYNLLIDSGATLEVRVVDLDRMDSENKPTVVIRWKTEQATFGWGLFREKMDKTVRRAKIQIEANMNAGSDVAIEYFTVFNFEVETNECHSIDEFAPTTTTTTTTTTSSPTTTSTTILASTTTTLSLSTSISEPTTWRTTSTLEMSTAYSPRDESTPTSTEVPTTTTTMSSTSTSTFTTAESSPPTAASVFETNSNGWVWIMLTALFASLLCLAIAASAYIYAMNKHLLDLNIKLKEQRLHRLDHHLGQFKRNDKQKLPIV
ncbi:AAEL000441-PA [Aedes aegypti]|nr:AAEL000441-PA [Aedes aegypti]